MLDNVFRNWDFVCENIGFVHIYITEGGFCLLNLYIVKVICIRVIIGWKSLTLWEDSAQEKRWGWYVNDTYRRKDLFTWYMMTFKWNWPQDGWWWLSSRWERMFDYVLGDICEWVAFKLFLQRKRFSNLLNRVQEVDFPSRLLFCSPQSFRYHWASQGGGKEVLVEFEWFTLSFFL